jgi:hypothetical protein
LNVPAQLKRLIPLFAIFISLFLLVRHFLIPDSFGQFGHYRGDSLKDIASKETVYSTKQVCTDCHDDILEMLESDAHTELSCLVCHGPGTAHVDDPFEGAIIKENSREYCGRCHNLNAARPAAVIHQVDIHSHNTEFEYCTDCHNPHQPKEGLR